MAPRHPLHADRQHHRDHRGQAFRHRGDGQRDAQDQHVEDGGGAAHVLHQQDGGDHHDRDGEDDEPEALAGAIELALQRRRLVLRLLQQTGDAAHLRAHAGRGHDRPPVPVGGGGAAEHHVVAIAERRVAVDRRRVLGHRDALAGQRGFGGLQRRRFDEAPVGRDRVALFDEHDVAGDHVGRGDALPAAAAHDRGASRGHRAQGGDRGLGARLLQVAHRRVEEHDREDRDGFVGQRRVALDQPQDGGDRRRHQQQHDEDVLELGEEAAPRRDRGLRRQLVAAVALEARSRLVVAEAVLKVRAELGRQLAGRSSIGWRHGVSAILDRWARRLLSGSAIMLFRVSADLEYVARFPSTLILNIQAQRSASQVILDEQLTVEPRIKVAEFTDAADNRFLRLETGEHKTVALHYTASVDCDVQTYRAGAVEATPVAELSASTIPYLFPSRYCQSDRLSRLAWDLFGAIDNPHEKVVAICDWIHANVEYLRGSTDSMTSAFDTVTQRTGVCRDFSHLGIALCRALNIPSPLFRRLRLRARAAGLPRLLRVLHRRQLDHLRCHRAGAPERPGADRDRPRRGRRRRGQHLRQRDVREDGGVLHAGRGADLPAHRSQAPGPRRRRAGPSMIVPA